MIEVRDLLFRYEGIGSEPVFGMRIESFSVERSSATAIVGPSGCGKSTLLGLVAGILRPLSGSIRVHDTELGDMNAVDAGRFRLRYIGQVFQSFELLDYLNVLDNVLLPWRLLAGTNRPQAEARAKRLLDEVGLGARAASMPATLSQGEQQRVAVCRAMLNNPGLILADEPTGNLDNRNKQNVVDLLKSQAHAHSSTLVMVTHDESLLCNFDSVVSVADIACSADDGAEL